MKRKFALAIRVLTVPPVMVAALLAVSWAARRDLFSGVGELLLAGLFLIVLPLLAYPLQPLIPRLRAAGRQGQRTFAFVTAFIGYAAAVIYGIVSRVSSGLMVIYAAYFASYLLLLLMNYVGLKASGHACGLVGPMILAVYTLGNFWYVLPCAALGALVVWSSLTLGRHTPRELILGAAASVAGFGAAVLTAAPSLSAS